MNFDIILLSPTRTLVRGGIFMSPAEYFGLHLHYETAMMFVRRGGPREQGRQENRSYERQELHGGSRALTRHNPWKNRGEPPPPEPPGLAFDEVADRIINHARACVGRYSNVGEGMQT